MSEGVVYLLEAVEIEAQDHHGLSTMRRRECLLEPLLKERAVGEISKPVMKCQMGNTAFQAELVCDVLVRVEPATVGHGSGIAPDRTAVAQIVGIRKGLAVGDFGEIGGDA